MKFSLLPVLLTCILSGLVQAQYCLPGNRFTEIPVFGLSQIAQQSDIVYGTAIDWQGQQVALELDAYYPMLSVDTLPLRPVILMVHGGGLISGDKINYTRVCTEFARRGFVALSINYRLGLNCLSDSISEEKAKYRAQQDIRAAFRFVKENASLLRIDTTWMFIGGGSAGAVAALGTVYISQEEWEQYTPGITALLGDLNASGNALTHTFRIRGVMNDWGAMLKDVIQPEEMLPMVSFHGDADSTVNIDSSWGGGCVHVEKGYGSRSLHRVLIENAVCSDLSVRPGGGHGVYQDSISGVPFRVGRAACFFKSLFCETCVSNYQTDSIPAQCSLLSGVNESEMPTLAMHSNEFLNWISTHPNPLCRIYTMFGMRVDTSANCPQLSAGWYVLQYYSDKGWSHRKLILL